MVRRLMPFALALTALAACNALNGAGDLDFRECPECDGGKGPENPLSEGGKDALGDEAPSRSDAGDAGSKAGGSLDTTFGNGGILVTTLLDQVASVAVRPDGKIYVAGTFTGELAVARFNANGTPDTTFGSGGRVSVPFDTNSYAEAIVIDAQGRAVVAGRTTQTNAAAGTDTYGYIVRIGETAVDNPFGNNGRKASTTNGEQFLTVPVISAAGDLLVAGRAPTSPVSVGLWQVSSAGVVGARSDIA